MKLPPLQAPKSPLAKSTLLAETAIVLLLSLGASAIWSVLSILRTLEQNRSLNQAVTTMNPSRAQSSWLDLAYQLVQIGLALVPVALALHLLAREIRGPHHFIGFDLRRPGQDLALGAILAAVIGIPGLAFYVAAREMGFNTSLAPAGLNEHWWTIPVLVLAAAQNAIVEEVLMIGYLFTRWTQAKWSWLQIVVTSALIRGCYHLYQGFGGFVGNVVMGLLLGYVYRKTRRVGALVVAHTLLDVVAFVGYLLLHEHVGWL